jgi:hypothetical protein
MKPVFNFGHWLDGRKPGSAEKYYKNFLKFNPMHEKNVAAFLNKTRPENFMASFRIDIVPEGEKYWKSLISQWHVFEQFLPLSEYEIVFSYKDKIAAKSESDLNNLLNSQPIDQFKEELV